LPPISEGTFAPLPLFVSHPNTTANYLKIYHNKELPSSYSLPKLLVSLGDQNAASYTRLHASCIPTSDQQRSGFYLSHIKRLRESQATVEACSTELKGSNLGPSQQAALLERRGNANYWLEHFNEAIDDFNKALELDKSLNEARIQRGWAHMRVGLMDRAVADFSNALAENPKSARAVFAIGYLYGQRGDEEKERQANEQAAALDPTYYLARYNLAKNCE